MRLLSESTIAVFGELAVVVMAVDFSDPVILALIGMAGTIVAAVITILPQFLQKRTEPPPASVPAAHIPAAQPPPTPGQPGEWAECNVVDCGVFYRAGAVAEDSALSPGEIPPIEALEKDDAAVLVVLVHGILGGPESTWGSFGKLLRKASKAKFDLLSYGYPAGLLHKASIESGAHDLITALQYGRFRKYPHLIFITHSTGGLLLKHVLNKDYEATLKHMAKVEDNQPWQSIAFRTRQIINIAVPHTGGSWRSSLVLIPSYHLLLPIFLVAMIFDAFLRAVKLWKKMPKGYTYGYNRIVGQLRWRNQGLTKLEQRYRLAVQDFDRCRFPRPVSIEINGTDDSTIDQGPDDVRMFSPNHPRATNQKDTAGLLFRGTHPTVKSAANPNDTIVRFLASFIERYSDPRDILLARNAVRLTLVFDRDATLIGAEEITAPNPAEWNDQTEAVPR